MARKSKTREENKDKWWIKPPRSSRICLRCEHKYSSHIDVRCLKIVQLKPERIECECKGFIANKMELEMAKKRDKKNMLLKQNEVN